MTYDQDNASEQLLFVTPQFEKATAALRRCFGKWNKNREGKLVMMTGPSGTGKTTIADVFLQEIEDEWAGTMSVGQPREDDQPGEDDEPEEDDDAVSAGKIYDLGPEGRLPRTAGVLLEGPNGIVRPIVKVFVEPKTRPRGLLRDIVRALGIMPKANDTFGELMEMLKVQLAEQGVRMIILDEVHHIVERQDSQVAKDGSNVVKMLLVQARTQVVCIGLPHAEAMIDINPELPRHVRKRVALNALKLELNKGSVYIKFLIALSSSQAIKVGTLLSERTLALKLHVATEGLIGRLTNLVDAASDIALDEGSTALNIDHLAEAFDDIEGTAPATDAKNEENPFRIKKVSEETFAPIRARIEARRRLFNEQAARFATNHPALTLR